MSLFTLGTIIPLLVDRFDGFDRGAFVQQVRLLSDGDDGPHEVLQSSGVPGRTANMTGLLQTAEEVETMRAYHRYVAPVTLTDGNGVSYSVRVLEASIEDMTHWWTFSALLYCTDLDSTLGS